MAHKEWHRDKWRAIYKKPDGGYKKTIMDDQGNIFGDDGEAAQRFGDYQEELIRRGKWVDPDASKITFGEWANLWIAGQDLEPSTMRNYRFMLQGHLIPVFAARALDSFRVEEMAPWERSIVAAGYAPRTAYDARSLLINILGDAVPKYIPFNPAARRRGKGKKGTRRVQAHLRAEKAWGTPLQAILIAERAAMLAGSDDVFDALVTLGWTGMRWSEMLALKPDAITPDGRLYVRWKLYEMSGDFYWGFPKDGSIRYLHIPDFLLARLRVRAAAATASTCTCTGRDEELPRVDGEEAIEWCTGAPTLFRTPGHAHYERGAFSARVMRPAADGEYPAKKGARARPARPVLVDVAAHTPRSEERDGRLVVDVSAAAAWPGRPVYWPWPKAEKGQPFEPPRGRGRPNWAAWPEGEQPHLASWLPILPKLTPHGLRHGYQTWMDDGSIKKALVVSQMGHEDLSMSGVYGHITDKMVADLKGLMQGLWELGIAQRYQIWPYSPVPALDAELARWREGTGGGEITLIRPA
ncbi:hypothetical protein [Herbidospora sp. RD11066]